MTDRHTQPPTDNSEASTAGRTQSSGQPRVEVAVDGLSSDTAAKSGAHGGPTGSQRTSGGRRGIWLAGCCVLGLAAAVGLYAYGQPDHPEDVAPANQAASDHQAFKPYQEQPGQPEAKHRLNDKGLNKQAASKSRLNKAHLNEQAGDKRGANRKHPSPANQPDDGADRERWERAEADGVAAVDERYPDKQVIEPGGSQSDINAESGADEPAEEHDRLNDDSAPDTIVREQALGRKIRPRINRNPKLRRVPIKRIEKLRQRLPKSKRPE